MKRHTLTDLSKLLLLGVIIALVMMAPANSSQVTTGTFKARPAAATLLQD